MVLLVSAVLEPVGRTASVERARDIGVPFEGAPGPLNAITDVPGVEVGQVSLISGQGPLKVGVGPVRTGVTIIFPRGRANSQPVYGGFFDLNGNGEMTGQSYLHDFGVIQGPIGITTPMPSDRSTPASSHGRNSALAKRQIPSSPRPGTGN